MDVDVVVLVALELVERDVDRRLRLAVLDVAEREGRLRVGVLAGALVDVGRLGTGAGVESSIATLVLLPWDDRAAVPDCPEPACSLSCTEAELSPPPRPAATARAATVATVTATPSKTLLKVFVVRVGMGNSFR